MNLREVMLDLPLFHSPNIVNVLSTPRAKSNWSPVLASRENMNLVHILQIHLVELPKTKEEIAIAQVR